MKYISMLLHIFILGKLSKKEFVGDEQTMTAVKKGFKLSQFI